MSLLRTAVLCTLLFCAAPSWALVSLPSSVEWLACVSEIVIKGRPTSFRTVEGPEYQYRYVACTFEVTAAYKGARTKEVTFYYQRGLGPPAWANQAEEYLVFLSVSPATALSDGPRTPLKMESHYDKALGDVLMPVRIFPLSVGALSGAWRVFNGEGRRLFMPESVSETARAAVFALAERRRVDSKFQLESRAIDVPNDPLIRAEMGISMKLTLVVGVPSFMFPEPKWWHFSPRDKIVVAASVFLGICMGVYAAYLYRGRRKAF